MTRFVIFMIDKAIHNHPFEIFLIEGQEMARIIVCANDGKRWSLLEEAWILWLFQDEISMLVIVFVPDMEFAASRVSIEQTFSRSCSSL
jgi:hypothetical protein